MIKNNPYQSFSSVEAYMEAFLLLNFFTPTLAVESPPPSESVSRLQGVVTVVGEDANEGKSSLEYVKVFKVRGVDVRCSFAGGNEKLAAMCKLESTLGSLFAGSSLFARKQKHLDER